MVLPLSLRTPCPPSPRHHVVQVVLAALLGAAGAASAGTATLSVTDARVIEGNAGTRSLSYTVTRTGDAGARVTVPYKVTPGTATAGSDYLAPATDTVLRLEPGAVQGTINVPVLGDTAIEPDETLSLTLGANPTSEAAAAFRQERQTLDTGTLGPGAGFADLNNDGRPDLVVANGPQNTVTVVLNKGTGAYRLAGAPAYPVGRTPQSYTAPHTVLFADFNGDGWLDVVTGNGNGTATVLINQGNGTFPTPTYVASSTYDPDQSYTPTFTMTYGASGTGALVVGDFNGDGKPDLAATDLGSGDPGPSLRLRMNKGDGTFSASGKDLVNYPVSGALGPMVTGDFDNNGRPDLALTRGTENATTNLVVLLNQGQGTFPASGWPEVPSPRASALGTGDFNGDNRPDVAALDPAGRVTVLLNQGKGVFPASGAPTYAVGAYPLAMAVGDINGDGKPDLAVGNWSDSTVSVLLNKGDGTFPASGAPTYPTSPGVGLVVATDLNGDNRAELILGCPSFTTTLDILPNRGDGTFPTARPPRYGIASGAGSQYDYSYSLASGDLNGDGKPDLVTTQLTKSAVAVLLNQGQGTFPDNAAATYAISGDLSQVLVGDFSGDGRPDLAIRSYANATYVLTMLINKGDGTFPASGAPTYTLGQGVADLAAGDFNNDGRLDVAALEYNTGNAYRPGNVTVLLNQGKGVLSPTGAPAYPVGNAPGALVVADVNGDSRPDLAATGYGADGSGPALVTVLVNRGDGTFPSGSAPTYSIGSYAASLATGDFNGDGRADLAATTFDAGLTFMTGHVAVLLNKGDGTFPTAGAPTYAAGSDPGSLVVSDFNGDGKADLATANFYANTVTVLQNSGSGTFDALDPISLLNATGMLAAADYNGDGKPDLAVATGTISMLLNGASPASTVTLGRASATGTIVNDDSATPSAFGFPAVTNALRNTFITSSTVTPQGFDNPAAISVSGGQYAIVHNGALGAFTTGAGTLQPGDGVAVRLVSSASASTKTSATLTVGGVTGTFSVTTGTPDTTPDAFAFGPVTGAPRATAITSQTVALAGFDTATAIKAVGGQYAILHNGALGAFTTSSGTVQPGDSIVARVTSASAFSTTTTVTVTVGGVAGSFGVTTAPPDTTPDAFAFTALQDQQKNASVTSGAVAITGIDSPAPVSVGGGQYAVVHNGTQGAFTTAGGTVQPGDSVVLRLTTANAPRATASATLTVGGVAGIFSATTTIDTTPDPFGFASVGGATPNARTSSEAVTLQGFDSPTSITVGGGQYAIVRNGTQGSFTTTADTLLPGDAVVAQATSAATPGGRTTVTVTVGGVAGTFTVTTVGPGSLPGVRP